MILDILRILLGYIQGHLQYSFSNLCFYVYTLSIVCDGPEIQQLMTRMWAPPKPQGLCPDSCNRTLCIFICGGQVIIRLCLCVWLQCGSAAVPWRIVCRLYILCVCHRVYSLVWILVLVLVLVYVLLLPRSFRPQVCISGAEMRPISQSLRPNSQF